jgi:signal transduction histidine kinase
MINENNRREGGTAPSSVPSRSELQKQVTDLSAQRLAISEVLRAIAGSPHDLQPILQTIIERAVHLCRAEEGGGVFRVVEKAGLRLVAQKSSSAVSTAYSSPRLIEHGSFLGRLYTTKSPLHIPDLTAYVTHHSGEPDAKDAARAAMAKFRTALIVPLLRGDELIGSLAIGRLHVEPFTANEIELVTDFAAQAAIALEIVRRERQLREVQAELAHANRIETIGQLSASIVHEVNQPLTGLISNSRAALNWLSHGSAKLAEAQTAIECVVIDGNRAAEIIGRIRDLIKKAPPKKDRFDMNEAIRDVIILTRGEAIKNGVSVQTQLAEGLPLVEGDRVQVQQAMLNLIINAIQAMDDVDANRDLHVSTMNIASEGTLVAVRDSGSGLSKDHLDRLFEPFYTTKPEGLGMGLAICRSIVDSHGGRIWATACQPHGALFQFIIPARSA